jgi:hypothetical protein
MRGVRGRSPSPQCCTPAFNPAVIVLPYLAAATLEEGAVQQPEEEAAVPEEHFAVVQVGSMETGYRRAGRGQPVLLLTTGAHHAWDEIFTALSKEFRMIQPVEPGVLAPGAVVAWLASIIEGLGLEQPVLLVDEGSAETAQRLARLHPGLAGTVVRVGMDIDAVRETVRASGNPAQRAGKKKIDD